LHYQSGTNHQGAAGYHANSDALREQLATVNKRAAETYNMLITAGVAKEEARMCLPLSVYTRFYWTASQQALWHFVQLRRAPGAQGAIRLYAEAVNEICRIHYKDAWQAIQEQQQ
jgi:thymidylate synthase (FAD)